MIAIGHFNPHTILYKWTPCWTIVLGQLNVHIILYGRHVYDCYNTSQSSYHPIWTPYWTIALGQLNVHIILYGRHIGL